MPSVPGPHATQGGTQASKSSLLLLVDQQQPPPPVLDTTMHEGLVTVLTAQLARIEDATHRYCEWHATNEGVLVQIMEEVNRLCASLAPHIHILVPPSSSSSSSNATTGHATTDAAAMHHQHAIGTPHLPHALGGQDDDADEDGAVVARLTEQLPTARSLSFAAKCEMLNNALRAVWRRWCRHLLQQHRQASKAPTLRSSAPQWGRTPPPHPSDGWPMPVYHRPDAAAAIGGRTDNTATTNVQPAADPAMVQLFLILHECLCCVAPPPGGHEAAAWHHVRRRLTFYCPETLPDDSCSGVATGGDRRRGGPSECTTMANGNVGSNGTPQGAEVEALAAGQRASLAGICDCLRYHRRAIQSALEDMGMLSGRGGGEAALDIVEAVCETLFALGSAPHEF